MKSAILLGVLALASVAVWALTRSGPDAAHLLLSDVVARPIQGGDAGIFLSIDNQGAPDRLVSVASPAGAARLYSPASDAGVPVPTGSAALALDGAHIRLSGADMSDGALLPITLTFETAGEVSAKARLSDPANAGAAGSVGLFGLGDICIVGAEEPAPAIALQTQPDGDGWTVSITSTEFTFSKDLMGLYHVPGMGHGHLYVGGAKLGRLFAPTARIGALPKGRHEVRVTLNTNDHRAYVVNGAPVTASAFIIVN